MAKCVRCCNAYHGSCLPMDAVRLVKPFKVLALSLLALSRRALVSAPCTGFMLGARQPVHMQLQLVALRALSDLQICPVDCITLRRAGRPRCLSLR